MNLKEVSCNFDSKNVQPFLNRIPRLIESGFTTNNIDQIINDLYQLKVDQEKKYEFPVKFQGSSTILKIQIVMDDIESPDLYIFTHPNLADEINRELQIFIKEQNL